ncbi:MFS transporter [Oceanobacillus picturae]|uniref:MFS transporter n=1 Tax=Oceanobacillus picturae TaxID=171693 RepID=W9APD3_9BACI|nr:hypothetical protein [Oceanobacillus picturae]GAQ18124.1 MFS transporter [Oceanobacillus picturae]CDO04747.1 hypothetical protein BN988_03313 [Oceanobacillus picturae]
MELAVFFFLSWLAISIFTVINKDLNIVKNTFIFLIILIVSINFSWVINDELKLITLKEKWVPYTAYLLNRSILIPVLVLLQVNLFIKTNSYIKKGIIMVSSIIILLMISFISTRLNMIEFKEWNLWLEAIYLLCLNLIGLISYTLFNKIKGVQENK